MKLIATTVVLLISLSFVFADFVQLPEAEKIAREFFASRGFPVVSQIGVEAYRSSVQSEQPVFYIVRFQPQGFVLIAAEEQSQPILGYSFLDVFPEGALPEHVKWYLDSYSRSIQEIRANPQWDNDPAWAQIRRGDFGAYAPTRDVAPLCQTTWDQDWPYNSMCPADASGPGGHVYAGCVATAMGQVMKKWNHPVTGNGSSSYYATGYGTQTANYGDTTYNWAGMPNSITSVNTPIATLLYHLGVAVEMQYAADGSGAYSSDARYALVNYFRYNSAAQLFQASSYSATTWASMLCADLDLGRPIYYGGQGPGGGHAFVLDGYQSTNYFHFNWGWSGYGNGYFYLSNLNPGGQNFNQNQEAMLHIYPVGGVPNDLAAVSVSGNPSIIVNQPSTFNVTISNVGTSAQTSYTVKLMRTTGITLASVPGTSISPGASITYPLTWTPTASGTFNLYARVELASDTNASNNESPTIPVIVGTEVAGDGFESYANFAISFAPWTLVDVDQSSTYTISGVNWLNAGAAQAYIIFVPSATTPPVTSFVPHGGVKSAACFASVTPPNNDWLITPMVSNPGQISFWAKSFTAQYGLERFKVGVSTTGTSPASFTIISGGSYIQAPVDWTQYTYDLSSYSGNVYVGIQCVSNDAFIFFVDDVLTSGSTQVVAVPTFAPPAGTYATAQNVAISCSTTGAVIRYTTNGTEPTETSTTYSTPINVPLGSTMTIKAKGYKIGWTPSATATATYIISGTVATPTFNPVAGTYATAQNVAISCSTADAVIRYTTNGTEPTETSTAYSTPINVALGTTMTIKAKGYKTGWNPSATATATYIISGTVATPTFSPAAGTYTTAQNVAISCSTADAVIRYTTNGTEPTETSATYTTPINVPLETTMTIKAKGYKTGWTPSATAMATYVITGTVNTPTFNPPAATYTAEQNVAISCSTAGSVIHYTTNGSEPTETSATYSTPINVPLGTTMTIKAKGYKTGWTPSATASATYIVTGTVATPSFNPAGGAYTSAQNVVISCTTASATIRYTTDGNEPTEASLVYSVPISVPLNTILTLKAKAYKADWIQSETATVTYVITGIVAIPEFNPEAGTYTTSQLVMLSCPTTDAVIRYTTNNTEPTEGSPAFSAPIEIPLNTTTTIKAKGFKTGWDPSVTATATYIVTGTVATPDFNPPEGSYSGVQNIFITSATPNAQIRYTLDGSDPLETSALYAAPIALNSHTTLKARAYKLDWSPSAINTAVYQIVVANEDELNIPAATGIAGIFPNPFRHSTTIRLGIKESPQPYTVKIYNIKGECVYSAGGMGNGYFNLVWEGCDSNDHRVSSGVYLLRFTSGNHQSVKKMLLQ